MAESKKQVVHMIVGYIIRKGERPHVINSGPKRGLALFSSEEILKAFVKKAPWIDYDNIVKVDVTALVYALPENVELWVDATVTPEGDLTYLNVESATTMEEGNTTRH